MRNGSKARDRAAAVIELAAAGKGTLQRQIRQKIIDAILAGVYPPGRRLPSSRKLSKQLGVARNTVVLAYQRLAAEGYKGFFEVDIMVDLDADEVYLGELNPRISGASSMTNVTAGAYADIPLFLFHLLEYMDVDYEIDVQDFGEGSEMSAEHPFAELVRRCISAVTGTATPTIGMTFTTDARFVRNQGGIPAVVCGPGDIAQAHGIDEWVAVSQLVAATAAYAGLYRSFGTGSP